MTQYARPDTDVTAGDWTYNGGPTDLWDCVNEVAPGSDSDYCEEYGGTSMMELGLDAGLDDPLGNVDHWVRWRWYTTGGGAKEKMTVELYEGGTLRATIVSEANVDRAWTLKEYELSSGEADSIGDYTNLRVRFTVTAQGGAEACQISWAEFECPDAALPPVNKDLEAVWDILDLVNKDLQAKWDIAELVYKDIEAIWDILGDITQVFKDLEVKWDIFELVSKDLQAKWDMFELVYKDIEGQYDIFDLVDKDLQIKWDIFELVSKDLQIEWDIFAEVYKDIQAVWDMEGIVGKNIQAKWDILGEGIARIGRGLMFLGFFR